MNEKREEGVGGHERGAVGVTLGVPDKALLFETIAIIFKSEEEREDERHVVISNGFERLEDAESLSAVHTCHDLRRSELLFVVE